MKAKNDKQRKLKEDIGKWSAFYRENPHCLAVDYSSPIVNINILFSYFQTFHLLLETSRFLEKDEKFYKILIRSNN